MMTCLDNMPLAYAPLAVVTLLGLSTAVMPAVLPSTRGAA